MAKIGLQVSLISLFLTQHVALSASERPVVPPLKCTAEKTTAKLVFYKRVAVPGAAAQKHMSNENSARVALDKSICEIKLLIVIPSLLFLGVQKGQK